MYPNAAELWLIDLKNLEETFYHYVQFRMSGILKETKL